MADGRWIRACVLGFAGLLSWAGIARGEAQADTTIVAEAEAFKVISPGWEAKAWGTNYYAATMANTFLSRKAYLGAPEQCDRAEATMDVTVPKAGAYLALV